MNRKILTSSFLYITLIGISLWIITFVLFCLYALSFKLQPAEKTDAIIVLTGGTERIQTAFNLLEKEYADNLLISGVHKSVQKEDLIKVLPDHLAKNITLGYQAKDTRGNAQEIASFIQKNNIHSVLLVTSFYHMPRSTYEVLKKVPHLKIVPLPVFPKSFGDSVDWIRTRYAWLLFIEYHKFIAAHLRSYFERIIR